MVENEITVHQATVDDIPDLVRLRRMMFEAMGFDDPEKLAAGDAAAADYFDRAIPSGEFLGWLAVTPAGEAVSTSGLVIDQHPPGPGNLSGKTGYIVNHPRLKVGGLRESKPRVDQGEPRRLAIGDMATLDVGQKTHRRVLPQPAALEGVDSTSPEAADRPRGRRETGHTGARAHPASNIPEGSVSDGQSEAVTRESGDRR